MKSVNLYACLGGKCYLNNEEITEKELINFLSLED
jgi:hypothetical protein